MDWLLLFGLCTVMEKDGLSDLGWPKAKFTLPLSMCVQLATSNKKVYVKVHKHTF